MSQPENPDASSPTASSTAFADWLYGRWQPVPSERMDAKREAHRQLAHVVRRLEAAILNTDADAGDLAAAATALETLAVRFGEFGRGSLHPFTDPDAAHDPNVWTEWSPVYGQSHPLAPPINVVDSDGVVVGEVVYGPQFEGPPGCVHGGFIAAAFDDLLGAAQSFSGLAGYTGTLTVRYRAPAPLGAALTYRARFDGPDGRKLRCSGTLHHGDVLCAEADAIFVVPAAFDDTIAVLGGE